MADSGRGPAAAGRAPAIEQYEVSAYARDGARCRHNLNYWQFGDYVGIGAGAHGKLSLALPDRILRTVKPKQPREYQEQMQARRAGAAATGGECRASIAKDLPFEFMLNALRLNEGFAATISAADRSRAGVRRRPDCTEPSAAGPAREARARVAADRTRTVDS